MTAKTELPRLGFLGTGWIGRHRMEAIHDSGEAEVAAIADTDSANAFEAANVAPGARVVASLDELLEMDLDGIVIATPSACHCEQAIRSLQAGKAVFCQKPLGRDLAETREVVKAARQADRLLAVDFSYRFTDGITRMHEVVKGGEIGEVYAADLVFHNAYGPDKPWFYDLKQSGGGCLMDLGSHLVDLGLWFMDFPEVKKVTSSIFANGKELEPGADQVEDYAVASFCLDGGSVVRIACSWNLPAGRDAVIEATFYGTGGGVSLRNVNGSFYDFHAERFHRTSTQTLASPPDDWGGRAAVAWCKQLREGSITYCASAEKLIAVAGALDAAYGR